ncbi:unnamed protein product [Angiostrongylus costaricensis]|uniref:Sacchrp_dh_C domain-containing protein n=1 Tax=Angiostrongylus costaricensis TaxID=334426 RepID=A0A0R3PQJ6_ANGCS|nr:unnamed protein product [Angiostrongylus costaricensis]
MGVYVVGACGWDSIPCDLGVNFLKEKFDGDLNHVETFVQLKSGPLGYAINAGTYQTLILAFSETANDGLGKIRRAIMPEKIVKGAIKPPKRGTIWHMQEKELDTWAMPFLGSDKSIVNRSQYYDAVVHVETYRGDSSLFWAIMIAIWIFLFSFLVQYEFTRKILQKYPDLCSFNMFKNSGPTEEQIAGASFVYWFFGYGYSDRKPLREQHVGNPDKRMVVTCKGPDAGYMATSACVLSAALALIHSENLPEGYEILAERKYYLQPSRGRESIRIWNHLESFSKSKHLRNPFELAVVVRLLSGLWV